MLHKTADIKKCEKLRSVTQKILWKITLNNIENMMKNTLENIENITKIR